MASRFIAKVQWVKLFQVQKSLIYAHGAREVLFT